jgi:dihydroorotase
LLQSGHLIDSKNNLDRTMDVGIKDGKIAAVAEHLNPKDALKTIDASGFYVTPGLIDIHTHDYASTGEAHSYAGDYGIWPDDFTFRTGVTTVVDAGSSGWRNFEDFKEHIIDREQTRVLAFINIVGAGMRGSRFENNIDDMQMVPTGFMALRYPDTIVGIKSAHFTGPEWTPYIQAVGAGNIAHIPVMIDYGANRIERPLYDLLTKYLRPGDIYTHTYSGLRGEQDAATLGPSKALLEGRQRGIFFDAGTGGGSFRFRVAVPLIKAGFLPDSLSTDLHADSMNSSTKDMLNVMSKFMAMGLTLQQVVADTTWHPAQEIRHPQLGNLSVGAPADVAVLSEEHGKVGYLDMDNTKLMANTRIICELTVRDGKVVFDLNGISMDPWNDLHPSSDPRMARHWTVFPPRPPLPDQLNPRQPAQPQ